MKEPRDPPDVHAPLAGYSHQIAVKAAALAGDVRPGRPAPRRKRSRRPCRAAGGRPRQRRAQSDGGALAVSDLVKLTMYLDVDVDLDRRRAVLTVWLGEYPPCMTLLFVLALATSAYRVELDAWACADSRCSGDASGRFADTVSAQSFVGVSRQRSSRSSRRRWTNACRPSRRNRSSEPPTKVSLLTACQPAARAASSTAAARSSREVASGTK